MPRAGRSGESIEDPWNIQRKSIDHLSNLYRTSIRNLSNIYRASFDVYRTPIEWRGHGGEAKACRSDEGVEECRGHGGVASRSKIHGTSNETLSTIYQTSIEHLSEIYRTSIEHRSTHPSNSHRQFTEYPSEVGQPPPELYQSSKTENRRSRIHRESKIPLP